MNRLVAWLAAWRRRVAHSRSERRWARLRSLGMRIGNVTPPPSTWVDEAHAYLITIGDDVHFGPDCLILAHDAQMDEFLDAARLGKVTIHPECHIGARTIVLAGVEIGPRTIVQPGSVVMRSLPPDTVCGGSPARVIGPLEDHLEEVQREMAEGTVLSAEELAAGEVRTRIDEAATRGAVFVRPPPPA